ncbi:hypothetical protein KBG23_01290 [Candidatus Dojkabacteria bacterium]|jgi:H+/gluconate symporter-like permease|nr:hypothetical protein [Candidatus Dojkabacteria bacterium]
MGKIKTFLTILILIVMTSSPIKYTYAQEEAKPSQEETIESVEEEETQKEDKETEKKEEEVGVTPHPFGTVLLAILIPAFLIIIAYLIFKFVKF